MPANAPILNTAHGMSMKIMHKKYSCYSALRLAVSLVQATQSHIKATYEPCGWEGVGTYMRQ